MNSREARRLQRIGKLKDMFADKLSNGETLDYEFIISEIMINDGVERKKAIEYIKPLIIFFSLELRGGKLCKKTILN